MATAQKITVETTVSLPVEKVWELWTNPLHITQWNSASDDWHTPHATNDLRVGGTFSSTMAARDGSFSFDFEGTYTEVKPNEQISYALGDGRKIDVYFKSQGDATTITETFDPESENPAEMQQQGWQAILDHFKRYAEYTATFEPSHYSITIDAPKETVWNAMLRPDSYKEWTGAAWPNSIYEGTWEEGEAIFFMGPDRSGTKAILRENRPYEFTLAEHVAMLDKGTEDTESEMAQSWVGSKESYRLTEKDGQTTVDVLIYFHPKWNEMFAKDWPKALAKLKEVAEGL